MLSDINRLTSGPRDKNNNDLSDIHRGRIIAFKELISLHIAIQGYIDKREKAKEEEVKKKGA